MENENIQSQIIVDIENTTFTFFLHNTGAGLNKEYISFHSHPYYVLCVAYNGALTVETDGEKYNLSQNDALILPPDMLHRFVENRADPCFSVGILLEKNSKEASEDTYTSFQPFFESLYCIQLKNQLLLAQTVAELVNAFTEKQIALLFRIKASLSRLVIAFYDALSFITETHNTEEAISHENMDRYKNANMRPFFIDTYLHEHFRENLALSTLAEKMFISTKQLNRIIKKQYNKTFYQYLTYLRIEEAKKLLMDKTLTIEEIAYLVGYSTHTGFYKAFRQMAGQNPSDYRVKETD